MLTVWCTYWADRKPPPSATIDNGPVRLALYSARAILYVFESLRLSVVNTSGKTGHPYEFAADQLVDLNTSNALSDTNQIQ